MIHTFEQKLFDAEVYRHLEYFKQSIIRTSSSFKINFVQKYTST